MCRGRTGPATSAKYARVHARRHDVHGLPQRAVRPAAACGDQCQRPRAPGRNGAPHRRSKRTVRRHCAESSAFRSGRTRRLGVAPPDFSLHVVREEHGGAREVRRHVGDGCQEVADHEIELAGREQVREAGLQIRRAVLAHRVGQPAHDVRGCIEQEREAAFPRLAPRTPLSARRTPPTCRRGRPRVCQGRRTRET